MGPPSCMRSVVVRNVVMRRMYSSVYLGRKQTTDDLDQTAAGISRPYSGRRNFWLQMDRTAWGRAGNCGSFK